MAVKKYNSHKVEKKWRELWEKHDVYNTDLKDEKRPKYYNLVMFPYPSGDKLHIGHWYSYAPADTWGRYMRMKGHNVFQPIGFDSFGLPAENYAIKTGVHPAETTKKNTDYMREQLKAMGAAWDWVDLMTSDPSYYKWTQWIFLKLHEKGLAYHKEAPVNWCPSCKTVLANEQAQEGTCERCDSEVEDKKLTQWFFKTKDYAEKLLDYEGLDWPEKTITMQKNWIGRSEGVNFHCKIKGTDHTFDVFDSVPQTHMAQTFAVIAPEHPVLEELAKGTEYEKPVMECVERIKKKKLSKKFNFEEDLDGTFTGLYIEDPYGTGDLPLWVASFVVMDYGSGIVNCSAHDERDFDFAKKYDIPLRPVMFPPDKKKAQEVKDLKWCYHHAPEGILQSPEEFKGRKWGEAREDIIDYLENKKKIGTKTVNYKLRDWLLSRQRYWGAPIPIVYCDKCGEVPVPEDQLPVELPTDIDFKPTGDGKSPLSTSESFVNTKCPKCDGPATRETDTMDTFVCSSWYYLRYPCFREEDEALDKAKLKKWMPIDMYIGGPEHACMHLIYARFINQVLHDLGHTTTKEPFKRLIHQGMITKDGAKMSKSKGNVVSPDEFIEKYGSDVFRMYLMFMGPFTQGGDWNDKGITGIRRFVDKFWKVIVDKKTGEGMDAMVEKTIKKVTEDMEKLQFNTTIAAIMELINEAMKKGLKQDDKKRIAQLIAPLAPHLAEESWEYLEGGNTIFNSEWPEYDPKLIVEDKITIAVQINGKLRGTVEVDKDATEKDVIAAGKEVENVIKHLEGKDIVKEIYVPGKLVSLVVK